MKSLLVLTLFAGLAYADVNDLYQKVIDSAKASQSFNPISENDLSQGAGQNYMNDAANHATHTGTATSAGRAGQADYATRAGRANSATNANYATTAGTASKVATSERNAIIAASKNGSTVQLIYGKWTSSSYCGWCNSCEQHKPSYVEGGQRCYYLKVNGVTWGQESHKYKHGTCGNDNHNVTTITCQ